VYDAPQRTALANELAAAFLAGPWKVDELAESGAGRLDRWPGRISGLALSVAAVYRTAPIGRGRAAATSGRSCGTTGRSPHSTRLTTSPSGWS
jgi:hypothetical protein